MGIFKKQIPRLRREKWRDADELAVEIAGIFGTDEDVVIDSPVRVKQVGNVGVITFNRRTQGDAVTFNRGADSAGSISYGKDTVNVSSPTIQVNAGEVNFLSDTITGAPAGKPGPDGPPGKDVKNGGLLVYVSSNYMGLYMTETQETDVAHHTAVAAGAGVCPIDWGEFQPFGSSIDQSITHWTGNSTYATNTLFDQLLLLAGALKLTWPAVQFIVVQNAMTPAPVTYQYDQFTCPDDIALAPFIIPSPVTVTVGDDSARIAAYKGKVAEMATALGGLVIDEGNTSALISAAKAFFNI